MSERMDINRLLLEMRAIKAQSQAFGGINSLASQDRLHSAQANNGPKFSELMSQAIDKVNEVQNVSGDLRKAYLNGEPNVDITDVMIASQKAGIAFDSMVQVRNKLVEAYRDVMNMPI